MKLVSDSAYSAMKQAADNWQKLTQQITEGSDEQPEQITVESLMEGLELPSQLAEQAKQQIQERDNEIARLKAEIEQLKQTPAAQPAEAHVQQEPGAGAEDITTYAEEHGTLETMAKAKELGFFNLK